jgi:Uma2 family endonuclease
VRGHDDVRALSSSVKLTYDDFVLFPDDGMRHELIGGVHYVTPSPSMRHQWISGRLFLLIGTWLETHPIGRLYYAPCDVVISHYDIVVPDLVYFSNERAAKVLTPAHAKGAPDIAIEIASPGTRRRDDTIKRDLYEGAGVAEYWTVDPDTDTIHVYVRESEVFGRPVEFSRGGGDIVMTPLLPGLDIPLVEIFRD